MSKQEIIEGNKLIAEFMGDFKLVKEFKPEPDIDVTYQWLKTSNKSFGYDTTEWRDYSTDKEYSDQVCYNSSWDWLMPVVEKVESLELGDITIHSAKYGDDIYFNCSVEIEIISSVCNIHLYGDMRVYKDLIYIHDEDTKIKATYKAVIEFIKWYNEQK